MEAQRGYGGAKRHHRDAQLRRRTDAMREFVPRRRCRAYRAADRCEGPQPRGRGRARPRARDRGVLPPRLARAAESIFGDLPAARMEGAALLVVDDLDATSLR